MKYPFDENSCCRVDLMEILVNKAIQGQLDTNIDNEQEEALKLTEDEAIPTESSIEHTSSTCSKPSSPQLELKPLPTNLRYEFLDAEKTRPVIVGSHLDAK